MQEVARQAKRIRGTDGDVKAASLGQITDALFVGGQYRRNM